MCLKKEGILRENVTAYDIIQLLFHLAGRRPLNSPYKIIAADTDGSGVLDVNDRNNMKDIILRNISALPNGIPNWRFVPTAYEFDNPENPLQEAFPESIEWQQLSENIINQDFVAIKMADLTVDPSNNLLDETGDRSLLDKLTFVITDKKLRVGEEFSIGLRSSNFENIALWQLAFEIQNKGLELLGYLPGTLPEWNESMTTKSALTNDLLPNIWYAPLDQLSYTATEKENLIYLRCRALKAGYLSDFLSLNVKDFDAIAFNAEQQPLSIDLVFENSFSTITTAKDWTLALYPNPVQDELILDYDLTTDSETQIYVMDVNGKVVYQESSFEKAGTIHRELNVSALLKGVYSLVIYTTEGSLVKKVVKM